MSDNQEEISQEALEAYIPEAEEGESDGED
jgi:hypothetical protein